MASREERKAERQMQMRLDTLKSMYSRAMKRKEPKTNALRERMHRPENIPTTAEWQDFFG